jgi:hypothetical protein
MRPETLSKGSGENFSQLLKINFVEGRLSSERHGNLKNLKLFRVYCERRFTTEAAEHAEFRYF